MKIDKLIKLLEDVNKNSGNLQVILEFEDTYFDIKYIFIKNNELIISDGDSSARIPKEDKNLIYDRNNWKKLWE